MNLLHSIRTTLPPDVAEGSKLFVALSGGADSVCLLLALRELGFCVEALHCNFQLRAAESDADEAFCRRLCRTHSISLHVRHFRTASYASRHRMSIEMAARQLRYDWFAEAVRPAGDVPVCVAHHQEDNAETVVLALARGTGIRGLAGMAADSRRGNLRVLRPLLRVRRTDIEAWLAEREQTWTTDSTNLDAGAARRNLVRLRLMPLLEELTPHAAETLAATAERLREAGVLYDEAVRTALGRILQTETRPADEGTQRVSIPALKKEPAARTLLHEWLYPKGFNETQISELFATLGGESGRLWESATHRLLRDRNSLHLQPKEPVAHPDAAGFVASQGGQQVLPLEGLAEPAPGVRLLIRRQAIDPGTFTIPRDPSVACFDLTKLQLPLVVRRVQPADRMQPFGFNGTRLVSDILTDAKLSLFQKERQLAVLSGERIVWLVGMRVAAGAEVDALTRHVMTITLLP